MREKIALLGSTGSIGTQALDIISKFPEKEILFIEKIKKAWDHFKQVACFKIGVESQDIKSF
jgi:1-deoxy-D-xylulose 5-phosphate reductoisomerase